MKFFLTLILFAFTIKAQSQDKIVFGDSLDENGFIKEEHNSFIAGFGGCNVAISLQTSSSSTQRDYKAMIYQLQKNIFRLTDHANFSITPSKTSGGTVYHFVSSGDYKIIVTENKKEVAVNYVSITGFDTDSSSSFNEEHSTVAADSSAGDYYENAVITFQSIVNDSATNKFSNIVARSGIKMCLTNLFPLKTQKVIIEKSFSPKGSDKIILIEERIVVNESEKSFCHTLTQLSNGFYQIRVYSEINALMAEKELTIE